MAQTIKLKRSSVSGNTPTTSDLELGEVAINTYDGKMFIKKNDGSDSIVEIGGSSGTVTDAFKTIAVSGQTSVVADSATDTLTLVAGSNMTITTNATGDSITFASTGSSGSATFLGLSDSPANFSGAAGKYLKVNSSANALEFDTLTFSDLGSKPTTIAGYGITDALQLGTSATTALAGNTSIPSALTDLSISDGSSGQVLQTDGSGNFSFVNQTGGNSFGTIAVSGQSNVVADQASDTLTLVAGSNISLTTNASGDSVTITSTASGSGTTAADAIFEEYQFTATSGQTTFTGSDDNSETLSYTANAIQVYLNGIFLDPSVDYTATNGTSIVLAETVDANDYLQVVAYKKKISDGQTTVDTFSGNGSTTAFTLSLNPGDENNTRVFIDGVYQSKSNYSVSGTTLTFATAPPNGTAVEVEIGNRVVTLDTTASIDLPDNVAMRFGTGNDLTIKHDGNHARINNGTGNFNLQSDDFHLTDSSNTTLRFRVDADGATDIRYNGSTKLVTTSGGVTVTGSVTADSLSVDTLSMNGSSISASGNITLDVAGNINLDADNSGNVYLRDDGVAYGRFHKSNNNWILKNVINEGDILFQGKDSNGTELTALTLDMSAAGNAIFNSHVDLYDSKYLRLGNDADFIIYHDGTTNYVQAVKQDSDIIFRGNDGGSNFNALTIDMSAAGQMTTNSNIIVGGNIFRGNMQIASNEIDVSSGDLTLDVAGDIILDADGGDIILKDSGNTFGLLSNDNFTLKIQNHAQDTDIKIIGNDGGSLIDALTFDMSDAGTATFNNNVRLPDNGLLRLGGQNDFQLYHDGSNNILQGSSSFSGILYIQAKAGENSITATADGNVGIYHDGSLKLETTATGAGVTGTLDASSQVLVGNNDSIFAENNLRFKSSGAAYIDHNTVGQTFYFRTSSSSSLDTTPLFINSGGLGVPGSIQSGSSAGTLTLFGGATNHGGKIVLSGGNNTGTGGSGIKFYAQSSTATPAERMRITASGNVGIGTGSSSDPTAKLQIEDSNGATLFMDDTNGRTLRFRTANSGAQNTNISSYASLHLGGADNASHVIIDGSGNVGVGMAAPANHRMHIKTAVDNSYSTGLVIERSANSDRGYINYVGGGFRMIATDGDPIRLGHVSSTDEVTVHTNGYLGIGVNSPAHTIQGYSGGGGYYFSVGRGNTTPGGSDPWLGLYNSATYSAATYGWGIYDSNVDGSLQIWNRNNSTTGANAFTIKRGGNIGIGTTDPDESLHVSGGGIKVDGAATMASGAGTGLFLDYSNNVGRITALDSGVAWRNLQLNSAAILFYIANGYAGQFDGSRNLLLGGAQNNDSSASMGGQTPDLYVPGYTSLGGLRINGADTSNTLYKTGGSFSISMGDGSTINLKNTSGTVRQTGGHWEVLGGKQLRAYRSGDSAYGALYLDSAENLFIYNSWAGKSVVLKREGDFGIGTTTPDEFGIGSTYTYLAVGGSKPGILNLVDNSTNGSYLQFGTAAGLRRASIHALNGSHLAFTVNNSNSGTTLNEAMRIKNNGNVGIGALDPGVPLHVASTTQARLALDTTSGNTRRFDIMGDAYGLAFRDQTAAVTRATIRTDGEFRLADATFIAKAYRTFYNGSSTSAQYIKLYDQNTHGRIPGKTLHFRAYAVNHSEYSIEVRVDIPTYGGYYSSYGTMQEGQGCNVEIIAGGLSAQTNIFKEIIIVASMGSTGTADGTEVWLKIQPPHSTTVISLREFAESVPITVGTSDWTTSAPSNVEQTYPIKVGGHSINNAEFGMDQHLNLERVTAGDSKITLKSTSQGDPTLHFDSAAANRNAVIRFMDQGSFVGGRIQYVHNGDRMDFQSGSSTGATMSIKNGKVGIGTTSGNEALEVAGNIKATGSSRFLLPNFWIGPVPNTANNNNGAVLLVNLTTINTNNIGFQFSGSIIGNSYTGQAFVNANIVKHYSNDNVAFDVGDDQNLNSTVNRMQLNLCTITYSGSSYLAIVKNGGGTGTIFLNGYFQGWYPDQVTEVASGTYTITTNHGNLNF